MGTVIVSVINNIDRLCVLLTLTNLVEYVSKCKLHVFLVVI